MPERRSKGDYAIYFEPDGPCKDSTRHRRCPGKVARRDHPRPQAGGQAVAPPGVRAGQGRRPGRAENLRREIDGGINKPAPANYTLRRCCDDWPADGLPGRDPKTVAKNEYVLKPVLAVIGTVRLRDLAVTDVDKALAAVASKRSTSTVATAHLALTRAITWGAGARPGPAERVRAGWHTGRQGRPSRSMTLAQATAVTAAAKAAGPRTDAYVMLSLCTGVRTEEAGALRWQLVDFGDSDSQPPRPARCLVAITSVLASCVFELGPYASEGSDVVVVERVDEVLLD